MQWIGARSYAWYLWHWPLLLFAHHYWKGHPAGVFLMLLVSVIVAHLTFTRIEQPARKRKFRPFARTGVTLMSGVGLLLAAALGAFMPVKIQPLMTDEKMLQLVKEASKDLNDNYRDGCHLENKETENPPCVYGAVKSGRAIYLFGDSHAMWLER